jgi:hypothetical protein
MYPIGFSDHDWSEDPGQCGQHRNRDPVSYAACPINRTTRTLLAETSAAVAVGSWFVNTKHQSALEWRIIKSFAHGKFVFEHNCANPQSCDLSLQCMPTLTKMVMILAPWRCICSLRVPMCAVSRLDELRTITETIGYTWSYLACRTGQPVPIWQQMKGHSFQ